MKLHKIKSIKKIGVEFVYDIINVQNNHNYFGNSFVVSNSSADWNKRGSKELKKKLAQVRTKHLFYILAFPLKIYKLEKVYLESFVNYWCLSGDTKILIEDKTGTKNINMKDLIQHKNYKVATYNIKTKKIEYKKTKGCILTKKNAEVYEVELENGQKIKATEDHLFLTNNGYKKLIELKTGDSIVCKTNMIKIKKITKLKDKQDVYDILGVEDNHNFIANDMVVHNCDLFGRGLGAIYVKDRNPTMDSWRMKEFAKVGSYTEFTNLSKIRDKLKMHPNFWQIIRFPKPPRWLYDRYVKVRERNIYDDENVLKNVSKEDIHNALMVLSLRDIMMNDETLSMNRIILHISNEYDISLTKGMVHNAIDDAKQLIAKIREQVANQ